MKLATCLLALLITAPAMATDIPDLPNCNAGMPVAEGSIWVSPGGNGPDLEHGFTTGGVEADVRITLYVLNGNGDPIVMYPYEDIWLESQHGGLAQCFGGTWPDASTDGNGMTMFSGPFRAGGSNPNPEKIVVMIAGSPLVGSALPLYINSPDVNGDLVVNLSDISAMVIGLNGDYDWRYDFNNDGAINLSDIVVFATCLGMNCNS